MNVINPYVLIIIGIMLEIIGALFLAMESFGNDGANKIIQTVLKISNWSKNKFGISGIIQFLLLGLLVVAFLFNLQSIIGLLIPICFLMIAIPVFMDHHEDIENWLSQKDKENKISPIGLSYYWLVIFSR